MRFADTPFMKRVKCLADDLGVERIPYIMEMKPPSANTFLFYNNARAYNQAPSVSKDPFKVSGYVDDPDLRTPEGVSKKVADVLKRFRDPFTTHSIADAMKDLFEKTDRYSMRSYMFERCNMNDKNVSWCETLDKSTGWYDRSLTEST